MERGATFDLTKGQFDRGPMSGVTIISTYMGTGGKESYISQVPNGTLLKTTASGPGLRPSGKGQPFLSRWLQVDEEAPVGERCAEDCVCCSYCSPFHRSLKLHFKSAYPTLEDGLPDGEVMTISRPSSLGGVWCQPLWSEVAGVDESGKRTAIGKVREDFDDYWARLYESLCCLTGYEDVFVGAEKRFRVRVNVGFCRGSSNNCMGATPCRRAMIFDVLDSDGHVVSHLQRSYASGNRTHWVVEFPSGFSHEERAMLLGATHHIYHSRFEGVAGGLQYAC